MTYMLSEEDRRKLEEATKLAITACLGTRATGLPLLPEWVDSSLAKFDAALSLLAGLPQLEDVSQTLSPNRVDSAWSSSCGCYASVFDGVLTEHTCAEHAAMKEHPQP